MATETTKIGNWLTADLKLAPARVAVNVHRVHSLGEDMIVNVDLAKKGQKVADIITRALTLDMQAQTGRVRYVLRSVDGAGVTLASHTVLAQGSADSEGSNAPGGSVNAHLGSVVTNTNNQILGHYGELFGTFGGLLEGLRGDLASRDLRIEELESKIEKLQEVNTSLVIHTATANDGEATVKEKAEALLFTKLAENVDKVPGMLETLVGKWGGRNVKALPAANAATMADLRKAAGAVSDASIAAAIRLLMGEEHASTALALFGILSKEEKKGLEGPVKAILASRSEDSKAEAPKGANGAAESQIPEESN